MTLGQVRNSCLLVIDLTNGVLGVPAHIVYRPRRNMKYNEKNQIVGDIFIIPNLPLKLSSQEGYWEPRQFEDFRRSVHGVVDCPEDDTYLEVWCCTPDKSSSNWQCHYEMPDGRNFPNYLPVDLFRGKKEGDKVVISTAWGEVELTLNQLDHRYRRFGTFEAVMKRLERLL